MAVPEDEKAVLQRFAKYIFRRETAEIREDLHESVVEMVLHVKNKQLDRKTIRNEIKHQLGLDFDQSTVNSAIDRLVDRDFVKQKDEMFYLTSSRKGVIDKIMKERGKLLSRIEKTFISKYHSKLKTSTSEQDKTALVYLYSFLSTLFSLEARFLLGVLRCSEEDAELVKQYKPPKKVLNDLLIEVKERKFKKAIEEGISAIFTKNETISLLNTVARNYLYFQILNLDPECRLFQKETFSKKVLLLDTNFIIKLLLISAPGHKAAIRCVNLSRELGVQLGFTERTKQEFLDQLKQGNEKFKKLGITRLDTLSSLDEDFIASYAVEKQKAPKLRWLDFFYKYKTFETILSKSGITKYRRALPPSEVYENGLRGPVDGYVLTCAKDLTRSIKSESVTEHDSYHLLLVRKLRETEPLGTLGPQFWFLTFDTTLLCVDKGINRILESRYDPPSSIEVWAWIELVTPYFGPKIAHDAGMESFSDLMTTQFSLVPARINTKKLVAVQTPKINLDLFPPEQIKAILSDQIVEELWNKLQKAKQVRSPTAKKHQRELKERATVVAEKILTKKAQTEIIARYISAAISILFFVFALYCVLLKDYTGTAILGLLAIGLIAIAVGYSTIEVNIKKMYAKITRS